MSEHKNRAKVGSVPVALFAVAALSGCTTTAEPEAKISTVGQSLALQMATDSQYMMRTLESKTKVETLHPSAAVDLADPAQYRFVMNRLAAAGKTVANSPELFGRIQKSKDKALARAALIAKGGPVTNAVSTDWCRNFITLGRENKITATNQIEFKTTHPTVTCVNGAEYVYADISTYDSNVAGTENKLIQSAAGEDYSGGTDFTAVQTTPKLPAVLGRINRTDSLVIAYDANGTEQMTFSAVRSAVVPIPGTITMTHPALHGWIDNFGQVQMCQLRGLPNQCDYGVGGLAGATFSAWGGTTGIAAVKAGTGGTTGVAWAGDVNNYYAFAAPYNSTHIYLPTQGTFDVGATVAGVCAIKSIVYAEFRLFKTVDGGSCATTTSFASGITWAPGASTGAFRTISDFVNDGGTPTEAAVCTQASILNESVHGQVSIRVLANCGGTDVTRTLNFAPGGPPPVPAFNLYVQFLNSCFAEGTPIRRADGKTVAVQDVKSGDKIISDNKGTVLTVTGVSHGAEDEALVALRDDKGHDIKLTARHPLITAAGTVVFASSLKQNDKVMTDRGVATIVSATRVPVTGQVYSLAVGTAEEKAKVGKDGTTLFAGGFLAGDSTMQKALETKTRDVAQLSTSWQRDYHNASMNNPPMQRVLR